MTELDSTTLAAGGTGGSSREAYVGTASAAEIAERLAAATRVAVFTHTKPDGDAVGSALAISRALRHGSIEATPAFVAPWNPRFEPVLGSTPVVHVESAGDLERRELTDADTIAVVDTGSTNQLGVAAEFVKARRERTLIVDHHSGGEAALAPMRLIDTSAASATQLVADVAVRLMGVGSAAELPVDVAEPLYLGLATDTGWFKHPSVTPRVFRLAADLLEAGAEHNRLFTVSDMSDPPERLLLMQRALASLALVADRRAAVMRLSGADFAETGSERTDASGLIDIPKSVETVEVAALLYELDDGRVKLSLRSKKSELSVDVNAVAGTWGGGGHHHAAGATLGVPLEEAWDAVVERLSETINGAGQARD